MHSIIILAHFFPSAESSQNLQDLRRKRTGHKNVSFLSTNFVSKSSGYWGLFPQGESSQGVKLTIHLELVLRSIKRGSIHTLPHTSSWHSNSLVRHRDNFTFYTFHSDKYLTSYTTHNKYTLGFIHRQLTTQLLWQHGRTYSQR
jgi:hypothetical protein